MFIDFLTFSLRKYYFMLNLYRENEHQLALRFMGRSSRSHIGTRMYNALYGCLVWQMLHLLLWKKKYTFDVTMNELRAWKACQMHLWCCVVKGDFYVRVGSSSLISDMCIICTKCSLYFIFITVESKEWICFWLDCFFLS